MIFAGQVVGKVLPSAKTEVSRDGNALVVHRFDVNDQGHSLGGMEDFCALLGLCPAAKYETTWERIARAVRDHAPGNRQYETFRRFAATSLLTYAVRNADCHAKNLALLYTAGNDVHLSPVYDFLTTTFYASYQYNPPGIGFMGKKSWTPGQTLPRFIAGTFGIPVREQTLLVEAVSDAVPLVQEKMAEHADFRDNGERTLLAWQDGVHGLREKRVYAAGEWPGGRAFAFSSVATPLSIFKVVCITLGFTSPTFHRNDVSTALIRKRKPAGPCTSVDWRDCFVSGPAHLVHVTKTGMLRAGYDGRRGDWAWPQGETSCVARPRF